MRWKYPDEWSAATLALLGGIALLAVGGFNLFAALTGPDSSVWSLLSATINVLFGAVLVAVWFKRRRPPPPGPAA